ncbi:MAG: efflux transporter outer membrane subunit [Desulfobacterium sp.]|jgi:NodT family efflux transporter outer membrane factor (OMF) lipoprotein|nr:efflux transporter outer membrane subunit [Desulfobacterium sp.]
MSFVKALIIVMAMASLLASCSGIPLGKRSAGARIDGAIDKEIEEIKPDNEWSTVMANLAQTPAHVNWLSSFKDPVLLRLIEEGKENNRILKIAAANVDKARLLADQAGAGLKPTLDLAFSGAGEGEDSTSRSAFDLNLEAGWEADIWGRIRSGYAAGAASAQAIEADYIYARHSLGASIARGYFLSVESTLQINSIERNIALLEKILKIATIKYNNGSVTLQDVALIRSDLAANRENLIKIQGARRDALRALEVLIGRYPNAELDLPKQLPELPPAPSEGIPSALLERRPDIVSAERNVAAAFNRTDQAKAAALPRLSLTGSLGGASTGLSSILNSSNLIWQLAGNLLTPVFDAGVRKRDVEIATIEQEQALLNYGNTALEAFSDVERNLDQGQVLEKRAKALLEVKNEINKAYKIADLRYREGEVELIDVLNIQQRLTDADSKIIALKRAQLEQRINLYLALGGEW